YVFSRYNRKGIYNLEISLEKYNKSLKLLSQGEYKFEIDKEDVEYSNPFYFRDNLYLLATTQIKKTKTTNVYYHEIDKSTLNTIRDPVLLKSIQELDNGSIALASYEISRDKQTLAFYGLPGYIKKGMSLAGIPIQFSSDKDDTKGSVSVFGDNMEKKWELEFTFPYPEKLYDITDVDIDNNGNFYFMGLLYNEKAKSKVRGQPNYQYILSAFRNNGKEKEEYIISLDDLFITDCSFVLTDDNKIVCSGFYSTKGTTSIKGSFFMTIDPETKAVLSKGTTNFDTEFLKLFVSDNKAEKGSELANFTLDEIILRSDGGALLIGEKYYITTSTYRDPNSGSTSTSYHYHYNDIMVININPDNTVKWATKIPKKQTASSGFYLSYVSHVKDDMVYLIFNDNEKNLDEKNPDKIHAYDGKNSFATLVSIQPDGGWDKKALFSNKEVGVIMRPVVSKQINEDELLFYAEKGNKYVVGKLTFD
ncbi:MAG TPA: hypothetical protein VFM99_02930, partial [Chitinophagales bacterium]|nr:hypothetical protein [Chitinophagales bacterium]